MDRSARILFQEGRIGHSGIVDLVGMATYLGSQADVVLAYLFGSAARGQMHEESDIDIGVLLEDDCRAEALVERQLALASELAPYARQEVQVTLLNQAPPLLCYEAIKAQAVLAERSPEERVAFEVNCLNRYFDLQPMLSFFDDVLRRRIEEGDYGKRRSDHTRALDTARQLFERASRFAGSEL